jgi:hypothetical protein
MTELDLSRMAPAVSAMLGLRGAETPPLHWCEHPNRAAKKELDSLQEAGLFAPHKVSDSSMGAAVVALLYLWNGWADECRMYGQGAPTQERLYLGVLCDRQQGRPTGAKEALREVGKHSIYPALAKAARSRIKACSDDAVMRFRDILNLDDGWEPFAFIDMFEQVQAGKVGYEGEMALRDLMCEEFRLLFAHCYKGATGREVKAQQSPAWARSPRKRSSRSSRKGSQQSSEPSKDDPSQSDSKRSKSRQDAGQKKPPEKVRVMCPRCRHVIVVLDSLCGRMVTCGQCQTPFVVPRMTAAAGRSRR